MNKNKEELQKEFTEFKIQIDELREKLVHTGEQFLVKNFKEIFNNHPKLEEVRWTAYTPYFNDGEECTFRSGHKSPELEGKDLPYDGKEYKEIENKIEEFMGQFDDDLMYDLFGDHVEIVVTAEGMSVENYDHD